MQNSKTSRLSFFLPAAFRNLELSFKNPPCASFSFGRHSRPLKLNSEKLYYFNFIFVVLTSKG
jgi:hypothetical protein